MTKIELRSYLLFKDQMHLTPKGGILFPPHAGREDYQGFSDADVDLEGIKMERRGDINIGGAHILLRCDGSHSVDEIMKELYADKYDESVEPVLSYLNMATDNFDIDISDSPFEGETHITGSLDYYHPLKILFEVTTKCNLKYTHCNASAGPTTGQHVPTEDALSLLERLHDQGTRDVELTGEEPLIHADFLEIFRFCVQQFDQVVVATNGLLIDGDMAEEFARHTNVVVQISLDGSTSESHDKRWGVKGVFEKAVQAFRLLVLHGIPRQGMMTIGRDNIDETEDIIQLLLELGIRRIHCNFVRGGDKGPTISPHETLEWMQKVDELASGKYSGIMTILYEKERKEYSHTCGAGTTMLTIGPEGNVRPCPYLPEDYVTGGNVFETEDFNTVFRNPMNERFKTLEPPGGDMCKDCEFFEHCKNCFCNGILMYEDIREKCTWGTDNKLEEWINFPS